MLSIEGFPFQEGSSLSAGNIGYETIKAQKAMGGLKKLLDQSILN